MTKRYPAASVSRTLDPTGRSFTTVVGKHDRRITDADINLIQDIQDLKDYKRTENEIFSGMLAYSPFVFNPTKENSFTIPAFDVMFNGEVVTIGGNKSADLTSNLVTIPAPSSTGPIAGEEAGLYVVYLELWYRGLDPATGDGYQVNGTQKFIYPNGCIECDASQLIPDDVIDPFQGLNTTSRSQIQWAIRVTPISLFYDFTQYRFGLDPGANLAKQTVFGRAFLPQPPDTSSLTYAFQNMGTMNGDYGLWRAGDGNIVPAIPTLDGYTYAMPIAVVFQRNTGLFDLALNPFGCGAAVTNSSGTLGTISGRYDRKYADAVYPEDVVDTRMTVSLQGYDWNKVLNNAFADLVGGDTRLKISRGETPGNLPVAVASRPSYTVAVGPTTIVNADNQGTFDGYMNGFGTDDRVFHTTKSFSVSNKAVGTNGTRWEKGDVVEINLSELAATTAPIISYVLVQALTLQTDGSNSFEPVLLLSGQIETTGIGSRIVTIKIAQDLKNTAYDPGLQDLYVTIGIRYGVQVASSGQSGYSSVKIPHAIEGGSLFDFESSKTLSVFGVSDFNTTKIFNAGDVNLVSYNPQYSNKIFGTRAEVVFLASDGVLTQTPSTSYTTFTIPRNNIAGLYTGLYTVKARDQVSGKAYTILSNTIGVDQITTVIKGAIPANTSIVLTVLLDRTAQMGYNAPVKAITGIKETVLIGDISNSNFETDNRVKIVSRKIVGGNYIILLATNNCILSGISGDDVNKFMFLEGLDLSSNVIYTSYPISNAQFFNGFVTLTIPITVNGVSIDLDTTKFFLVGAIAPALHPSSSLIFSFDYTPYQGEGKTDRDYTFLYSEDMAYVTTNGTGAAPIVGLKDVYPYNRELPLSTVLPAQTTWDDAELDNQAVSGYFDSNYDAKRFSNVEHTFAAPLKTNDFIEPVSSWRRKKIRLSTPSGRGFAKAFPHVGFAIRPPAPKAVQGDTVITTNAPIYLYVNNASGNDAYDGLSIVTPKATIKAALNALPSVLRHPCYVFLVATAKPYKMSEAKAKGWLEAAKLGDGEITPINHYCLNNVSFSIQDEGRLYIGREANATDYIVIDASDLTPYGDGPTSAFVVDNSRVVFNGISFRGFRDASIYALSSSVELVDCVFDSNLVSGSFYNGCNVTASRCAINLVAAGTGFIVSNSDLASSSTALTAIEPRVNSFYVCERSGSLTLSNHKVTDETNISREEWVVDSEHPSGAFVTRYETIVLAKLNSSVVCSQSFASNGAAKLLSNATLTKPVTVTSFLGGIAADPSAIVTTDVS